jgi:spore cortex formation protein SpoVR/YcgB (stage V sporulation)
MPLQEEDAQAVIAYIADLWGYDVYLHGIGEDDETRYSYEASPRG